MLQQIDTPRFDPVNIGYDSVFQPDRLSVGIVVPIESYPDGAVPSMDRHLERVKLVEDLGFASVWLRDVPFNVPTFGDAGQVFDPFVYLGLLACQTERIALGVDSIILPLRHPAHVAKAAASVDQLSGGRLILGVASGDRPEEYPAMGIEFNKRGALYRESFDFIRQMGKAKPAFVSHFGSPGGDVDMLPKPVGARLPLFITGSSQQDPDWIARNGDGWMLYPRNLQSQARVIEEWRTRIAVEGSHDRPVMEPLYIDLADDPDTSPKPIHLGFSLGAKHLRDYLRSRQEIGVNHVALNLRFNQADIERTLETLAREVLPEFHQ